MNKLQVLNEEEVQHVSGGWIANAIGAAAGGIGGFYGSIIAGGRNATFSSIATATFGGVVAGAISPVRSIGGLVSTVGGAIAGGAVGAATDDYLASANMHKAD